jgi:hypothetical protein
MTAASFCQEEQPLEFANRLIRMLVDQSTGGKVELEDSDYMTMRILFRSNGGSWQTLLDGSPMHHGLIKDVVKAWVTQPRVLKEMEKVDA